MKKIISVILAASLMVGTTATTVFAKPAWKNTNGKFVPPGISKKFFDDSDEVKWAQKAIEKLKAKGLVSGWDGKYSPNSSVTKIEAVVMALRIMGWENEASSKTSLPKQYKGSQVQQWAVGYISEAYERGILDDEDMMYFKPQEPAKRHEVAKYIIKALGKEDEAKDHMDDELPFVDAFAVPQGSVGYVYLVNELGIMKGDGKAFNPMATLTRAEMAVLFNSLDEKVDSDTDLNEYSGTVYDMEDDEITLRFGTYNKTFKVSSNAVVYNDNTRISYSDIEEGDWVNIQLENNQVVYIEIVNDKNTDDKIISRYTGNLTSIGTGNPKTITVEMNGMTATFKVLDTADIYFKSVKGNLGELQVGDNITVIVDNNNWARKISVNREKEIKTYNGTLTNIDLSGEFHLYIDGKQYDLSKDADVKIANADAELKDLVIGMNIEVDVVDGVITEISAQSLSTVVEGVIEEIYSNHIKVKVGTIIKDYIYANNVDIDIPGRSDTMSNLEKGMAIEIKLQNNLVTSIYAEDNKFEISGKIYDITYANGKYTLKLETTSNEKYTYEVSQDAEIAVENTTVHANDLEEGMYGDFEIVNTKIVNIDID